MRASQEKQRGPKRSEVRNTIIPDHEGNDVNLAWYPNHDRRYPVGQPPPFPFLVYFTKKAEKSARDPSFAASLVCLIEEQGRWTGDPDRSSPHARFEFYTNPFSSILACVVHQRREIIHRNRNAVHPRLLATSDTGLESYQGCILVIDSDDCHSTGIIVVQFDPDVYMRGHQRENGYHASDIPLVESYRQPMRMDHEVLMLVGRLEEWWHECDNTWTEAGLARRNEGAASPALYPAVDPDSHFDVEHEAAHELDGTALPDPSLATDPEDVDFEEWVPSVRECFKREELFMRDSDLPHLATETYSDLLDQPVTSVWDRWLSKTRPDFSFTLYLGYDILPVRPKALFTCLNKGLLTDSQWTLDVMTNLPSLEAAFDYHDRNTKERTPSRLARLRSSTKIILDRINAHRLPVEILDHIESVLIPPEIPNYSSRPTRPHQNLFLYLDGSHLSTGPLVIYSNQARLEPENYLIESKIDVQVSPEIPVRVLSFCFWHRVADELHTLWSLCSPRLALPNSSLPTLTLRLGVPAICVLPEGPDQLPLPRDTVKLHLHSAFPTPITIHLTPLLSHDLFDEALELVDLATGQTLLNSPHAHRTLEYGESWLQSRELGYAPLESLHERAQHIRTLQPDSWTEMEALSKPVWWFEDWLRKRAVVAGRQYVLRLREDVRVLRWTYGSVKERKGPYNLPTLPLSIEGGEVRFGVEHGKGISGEEG